VDKWNSTTQTWDRQMTFYSYGGGASTINGSKYNPNLQCDLYGDWREEAVYWTKQDADYYLNIYTTTMESSYKLPWLRDDHVYDMAIAWQNCGYNQPPHLGYSPVAYYKELGEASGIITVTGDASEKAGVRKYLKDGRLLIEKEGICYHVDGIRRE
jgi:rhamnogalacturonan endolyase